MSSSYDKFCADKEIEVPVESTEDELNVINNHLDYMVQELAREFGNKLTFKGGYMLTKLMSKHARQTTDIDFSILTDEVYEEIKTKLQKIAEYFISKGIIGMYKIKENIQHTMSGGIDMYKDGQKILGVVVGWHNTTYGTVIRNLDVGELKSFNIERMMADKITAILSRKRFRRSKDIYDLFCISECFTFDAEQVSMFISKLNDGNGAEWNNYPFTDDVLREYEKAYNKLILTSVYKGNALPKPEFNVVYSRFCLIAEKVHFPDCTVIWDYYTHCFK